MLGWHYDLSVNPKTASLPPDKVRKTISAINKALDDPEGFVSLADVDSLHGLLQHCAAGLIPTRFHLSFTVLARSRFTVLS